MKVKKTAKNPYGLSAKQQIVIADMIEDVDSGRGLNPLKSHLKIYSTKSAKGASSLASTNLGRIDFREALIEGLTKRKIIGKNSKVEKRLDEGLDAVNYQPLIVDRDDKGRPVYEYKKRPDKRVRLAYIQEINKVVGTYAPEKKQVGRFNFNMDLTHEELVKRIKELDKELSE